MNNNIVELKKSKIFVGMDLSKEFHVIKAIDINGKLLATMSKLKNYYEAFEEFKSWINDLKSKYKADAVIIGMEPTGIYWQEIVSYIKQYMPDCEAVFVKHRTVGLTRSLYDNGKGKNDFIDALAIARCVKDNNYFQINCQREEFNTLKLVSRRRDDYLKRKNYLFNKLENDITAIFADYKKVFRDWSSESLLTIMSKYPLPEDIIEATEGELLAQLRTRIKSGVGLKKIRQLQLAAQYYLDNKIKNLYMGTNKYNRKLLMDYLNEYLVVVDKIRELDNDLEELASLVSYSNDILEIKGIGSGTVAALLAETGDINRFETGKQLISYVGFDLKECSSGMHKGKMKISKCGSRKLRSILFKVALPLIVSNEYFKIYYNHLTLRANNPLKNMQALIAVCCKLLRCIHGMVKNGQKFNGLEVIKGINTEALAS